MDPNIFKAYDIRGKYPSEINEEIVSGIISRFLTNQPITNSPITIVIGHDARLSSPELYKKGTETLKHLNTKTQKLKIIPVGLSTTPEIYFLVNRHNADFGIMITASHNPKEYNGIKIVGPKAAPISGKEVLKIISK